MDNEFIEVYKNIGKDIKNARKSKKMSQNDLANQIPKMDRAKISDIENGKEDYHLITLLKICKVLGLEIKLNDSN